MSELNIDRVDANEIANNLRGSINGYVACNAFIDCIDVSRISEDCHRQIAAIRKSNRPSTRYSSISCPCRSSCSIQLKSVRARSRDRIGIVV